MIDISQIVGNATAALNALKSPDATGKGADANLFHDALSRARQDGKPAATPATAQDKVPAKDSKPADASQDVAQKPQQPAPNNALPDKDKPAGTVTEVPGAKPSEVKNEQDATTSAEAAAAAAALAAAALLAQPVNPQAATANGGTAGTSADAAINGLTQLAAQAAAPAAAATATTATTAVDAAADAAALQAQLDAQRPATTLDTAAKGTTPSPTDTLALIAQQRAALQNTTPTVADKIAAAVTTPGQAAAQDAQGQGAGQQHANLGHSNQPALTPADNGQATQSNQPSASPFAAAQASARTGEAADTGATNASSAATLASAVAAAQAPAHSAQAAAQAAAARPVVSPNLNDSQWSQALGQQMVRLSTQGSQSAELDLNPPNLGPLKVVLNVVNDQAQAQFVSPHQAVRAAVEAALPQLRTSMAEAGIQLGQTSVGADGFAQANSGGQQQQQQRQASNGSFGQAMGFGNDTSTPVTPATPRTPRPLARGEVDTFA